MEIVLRWRRTEPVLLEEGCESWQLVDDEETEYALVFNTNKPDSDGNIYYWAVNPYGAVNIGRAKTAEVARMMAEKRLEEL